MLRIQNVYNTYIILLNQYTSPIQADAVKIKQIKLDIQKIIKWRQDIQYVLHQSREIFDVKCILEAISFNITVSLPWRYNLLCMKMDTSKSVNQFFPQISL